MTDDWPEGPFTRAELPGLGITPTRLRRGVASGRVRSPARGVYVAAHLGDTIDLRARAIGKVVSEHHVVIDRTAAWLHGVDVHLQVEHDDGPRVESCALRGRQPTRLSAADGRSRDLAPGDVMVLGGVRVTTPLRTALDLGCCLRRREAYAAMVMLARRHGLTAADLVRGSLRYRGRRGVVQLRSLAPIVDPRLESPREAWVLLEIADAGLPLPEPQVWVEVDGVPTYRLDFAYRERRVCVEYDGHDAHASEEQRRYDERRRAWLRREGWIVIVVRVGDFSGPALDRWLAELREELRSGYTTRRW
ncbi:DUF559 domain-containing protein [Nocardioides sp. zg-579]|uniref:DUF559 domain-containing protein n=1 Tax=Nocardioides marmotae TaxID=2663857 RepID=A0A6I3JDA2_9ACTN|nr:type IV toxin-antitoxin system AbiEi family antitoxin domain-containing protein [Nocardioides marmotae]MCR6032439.1 DUF559 domain-containing protein [Gordonia jinghuaiqii]MTB96088.1 DUF559 domain-containing protein [Nocardioides marmotae]QKD99830.1 DUF559 domain-containing protein [Nocardioides marmotae]